MHLNIKKYIREKFISLLIVVSFLYTFFYNLLFFPLENSPDYVYYFSYFETFFKVKEYTNLDQGLIYHFLISLVVSLSENSINGPNVQIYISNAIHLINNLLFLVSCFGVNHLLKFYKVKDRDRHIIILITIFLPFVTQARFHYKPEIFAIAFIPWMLFNFLKYVQTKNMKYLLIGITLFTGTAFLKGNILTMLSIFMFLVLFKDIKNISAKHIFTGVSYFLVLSASLLLENRLFNGTNLLSNTQQRIDSNVYQNTVSADFFTNFSFYKFIRKPNYDIENVNFFSTIFIDTFNDFFGVSWNIDHFPMIREYELFQNWILNGLFNYSEYYISFLLGIVFYSGLIYYMFISKHNNNEKIFYAAPFIGIAILFINSLGFPFKNFDPAKGDTFKSIYFSFLLFVSVIIILKNKIPSFKTYTKSSLVLLIICFNLFSMGINTEIFKNMKFVEQKSFVLEHTPVCQIGNFIDFDIFDVNCNPPSDSCGKPKIENNYTKREVNNDGNLIFFIDDKFGEIYLYDSNNLKYITVKGFDECYYYQDLGLKHPYRVNNLRIPFVNVFVVVLMLNGIFYNLRNPKNKEI